MRLLRLSLENWRGVTSRDIEFDSGVTLIEGPNEIGKSTIIEAIQMLFRELDSSKRREVKAIQPVGEDVGSSVELEVQAGDHHFIYAKTYNKASQTTLQILAPDHQQLTGREAHETVEQLLEESVDMALWDALLIDQGEKVGLANLQNSTGLASALDEAAGNSGDSQDANPIEESSLFAAVQAEYEKYFTLKTGRTKFADLEAACVDAETEVEAASARLTEVEVNVDQYNRQTAEVRRLEAALPELQAALRSREEAWQRIRQVSERLSAREAELAAAQAVLANAQREQTNRQDLVSSIAESAAQLESVHIAQAPLSDEVAQLKSQIVEASSAIAQVKDAVRTSHQVLELARADEAHLRNVESLSREHNRQQELEQISESLKSHLQTTATIKVDDAGLEAFRQAMAALDIARGKRDSAATSVAITALTDLTAELDGETLRLGTSESATRSVASELELHLPDVADIRITPSLPVAQLAEETANAEQALAALCTRLEVRDLEQAVAANQQRAEAQRSIEALKSREADLLQAANREEIIARVTTLKAECNRYQQQRESKNQLPESLISASLQVSEAQAQFNATQQLLDDAQQKFELTNQQYQARDGSLRTAQQELAGLEAGLKEKQTSLERIRAEQPDELLEQRTSTAIATLQTLNEQIDELRKSLEGVNPDVEQEVLENARAVLTRANADLAQARTRLAVIEDRLEQAQANGRFEELEFAERKFTDSRDTLESTRQRAAAAQLLWTTLNRHRDAARAAYVRPLKEAIERLGGIVFGGDFTVSIGDDWSIVSRTLNGKTISFDALSVGAKEQLGILARLAAAQIVSKQGGVPLIIDDALGFSDPTRLQTMGAAIAAAGRDCQVIILTCSPGRFTHVGNAKVVTFAEG